MFVTRQCSSCGDHLPLEAFNRHRDGHQWWCRECFRAYFRARGDRHRKQSRAAQERRLASRRSYVFAYLDSHPCVDCGEDDLRVLDFDHVEPRVSYVADLVRRCASQEELAAEVARCEVVLRQLPSPTNRSARALVPSDQNTERCHGHQAAAEAEPRMGLRATG